jgi:hypothetical protein
VIRIAYTATRALAGHAVGDTVTLYFSAQEPLTASRKMTRDTQKSLSGRRETLLHNALRSWNITTEPLQGPKLDALEEFLQAVDDGSTFEFEPYWIYGADSASQDAAETRLRQTGSIDAVLGSEQYDLQLVASNGNGGQDDWYAVTFTVEESP